MASGIVDTGYTQALGSGLGLAQNFMQMAMAAKQQQIQNERIARLDAIAQSQRAEENRRADVNLQIMQAHEARVAEQYQREKESKERMTPFLRDYFKQAYGLNNYAGQQQQQSPAVGVESSSLSGMPLPGGSAGIRNTPSVNLPNAPISPFPNRPEKSGLSAVTPDDMRSFIRPDQSMEPWQQKLNLMINSANYDELSAMAPLLEKEKDVRASQAMFRSLSNGDISPGMIAEPYKQQAIMYYKYGNPKAAMDALDKGMQQAAEEDRRANAADKNLETELSRRAALNKQATEFKNQEQSRNAEAIATLFDTSSMKPEQRSFLAAIAQHPELSGIIEQYRKAQEENQYRQSAIGQIAGGVEGDMQGLPGPSIAGKYEDLTTGELQSTLATQKEEASKQQVYDNLVKNGVDAKNAAIIAASSKGGQVSPGAVNSILSQQSNQQRGEIMVLDRLVRQQRDQLAKSAATVKSKHIVNGLPVVTDEMRKKAKDDPNSSEAKFVLLYDEMSKNEQRLQQLISSSEIVPQSAPSSVDSVMDQFFAEKGFGTQQ